MYKCASFQIFLLSINSVTILPEQSAMKYIL